MPNELLWLSVAHSVPVQKSLKITDLFLNHSALFVLFSKAREKHKTKTLMIRNQSQLHQQIKNQAKPSKNRDRIHF